METGRLSRLVSTERTNAALGWALVALVLLAGLGSFLDGDVLWPLFTVVVALVVTLPALTIRSARVLPPWELVFVAALPILGRLFATTVVTGEVATYLSVAALALLVAVDLDAFTPVRMNDAFAALFVVVTTMATAGLWAVVRWFADLYLGTAYITGEHALMVEFTASTVAGALAGLTYVVYRRRSAPRERLPAEVAE
ncbi:MAG: hypothetical protein ABEJ30_02400 [Halorientalis sp.]